jgi:hypothetical protein
MLILIANMMNTPRVIQFFKITTFIVEPVLYSWGEGLGRQLLYVRVDNQQNQETSFTCE